MSRRAIDLDENDAWAHTVFGWVRFNAHKLDAAIAECQRALELNPSLAFAESIPSISHSWRGDHDDAMKHAKMAEWLSPRDPVQSMWSFARTFTEFGMEHYEEAVTWAKKTAEGMPDFPGNLRYLAAGLGHLGQRDEARETIAQLLAVTPKDNLQLIRANLPSVQPERMERFAEGLRKAGLPE